LVYYPCAGPAIVKPTSYLSVIEGEDALAESYLTDTSSVMESTLKITSISKNKLEGEFQVGYTIDDYPFAKAVPWVPDQIALIEGKFNARK